MEDEVDKEFPYSDIPFRSRSGSRCWERVESESNQDGSCKSCRIVGGLC